MSNDDIQKKQPATLKELSEILMTDLSLIPDFPKHYEEGFQCLYIPAPESSFSGDTERNSDIITTASIGKIWSNQGLFPIIRDPSMSIFDGCPFHWFAGYSSTSHFEYVYYLDNRHPKVNLYFRGEYSFYGEDRRNEAAGNFRNALDVFDKRKAEGKSVELVFHVREFIERQI